MQIVMALFAGLVFGLGLIVSGMTDPSKVIGFLDLGGKWDPSLAFVMAGAIGVSLLPFAYAKRRQRAVLGAPMSLPTVDTIDLRLVFGSFSFGAGWGLAGFCPGPALVALGTGEAKAIVFVIAMVAGMGLFEVIDGRTRGAGSR